MVGVGHLHSCANGIFWKIAILGIQNLYVELGSGATGSREGNEEIKEEVGFSQARLLMPKYEDR